MTRRRWTSSDPALAAVIGLGIAITRIPFLSRTVYGLDPDAARIAASGVLWAEAGAYVPSRLPSYPFPEAAAAVVWELGGGALALNALSTVLSGCAAAALFLLLRGLEVGRQRALLGAVAALMTPVAFGASVQSMDYIWALAPALGALAAAVNDRPLLGGMLLGTAVAARLTSAILAVPALLLLSRRSVRNVGVASGATVAISLLAYALPLRAFGLDLFWFYDAPSPLQLVLQRATLDVWGVLGLVALGIGGLGLLVARRPVSPVSRRGLRAFGIGAALVALSYLRLPLEGGYLLPAVPLVVGLLAISLRGLGYGAVCALLIASPFALDLESAEVLPEEARVLLEGPGAVRLLAEGPVLIDHMRRQERSRLSHRILETADRLGAGTGLQLGVALPEAVMAALHRPQGPPKAWLLYGGYPPRPWPLRTADEVLTLWLDRPPPQRVVAFDDMAALQP